jgi:hypothetical protein
MVGIHILLVKKETQAAAHQSHVSRRDGVQSL